MIYGHTYIYIHIYIYWRAHTNDILGMTCDLSERVCSRMCTCVEEIECTLDMLEIVSLKKV